MKFVRSPKKWVRMSVPLALSLVFVLSLGSLYWRTRGPSHISGRSPAHNGIFVAEYPAIAEFEYELRSLRRSGKLKPNNEQLIDQTIVSVASHLAMPPAVLWCLLFQESRLDHLSGMGQEFSAQGLGQFSRFSFYEFNHDLERWDGRNLTMVLDTMGSDVRPISANRKDIFNYSSYYFIPTAVAASAAYLNNRYHQLGRILELQGYRPDPDLLWLYAAMAYNKGTRSVLSFWNQIYRESGTAGLARVISSRQRFVKLTEERPLIQRALNRIWATGQADSYSQELILHVKQIRECSLGREGEMVAAGDATKP